MSDHLWTEVFFAYEPLVGFDEAVRIAEEHVPTIGTAPVETQHTHVELETPDCAGDMPLARPSSQRIAGTCLADNGAGGSASPSRPNTVSAQADRGGGGVESRHAFDGRQTRAARKGRAPGKS